MWEGWNKKTHERQRLSPGPVLVLRVNKRLHATWPFVFALGNVPFTPHSQRDGSRGNGWEPEERFEVRI